MMNDIQTNYEKWMADPSPDNMGAVLNSLNPVINSEITKYNGPSNLLKRKARVLAVDAVKKYDPLAGTKLNSWIVTSLKPLHRYSKKLTRPVQTSELAYNQSAELWATERDLEDRIGKRPTDEELADETGLSVKRIQKIKTMMPKFVHQSVAERPEENDDAMPNMPGVSNPLGDPALDTAAQLVYNSLNRRDKMIYDMKTGTKGVPMENMVIARKLGVSPGLVSQRSAAMAEMIRRAIHG